MAPRPCNYCGQPFEPAKASRRFCSKRCSNLGQPRGQAVKQFTDGTTHYGRNAERIKADRRDRYAGDADYRQRVLARAAARRAFPDPQPCEVCGDPDTDRHHDDYSKPLAIRWLCRQHHISGHVEQYGTWGEGLRRS